MAGLATPSGQVSGRGTPPVALASDKIRALGPAGRVEPRARGVPGVRGTGHARCTTRRGVRGVTPGWAAGKRPDASAVRAGGTGGTVRPSPQKAGPSGVRGQGPGPVVDGVFVTRARL